MTQERAGTARGAVVMETRSSQLPTTTPSGPRGFRPARWWRAGGSVRRGTPRRGFRAPRATQVSGRGTGEGPRDRRGAGAGQAAPRGGSGAAWPGRARDPRGSLRRLPRDEPTLARASLGEPASVRTLPGAGPHRPPSGSTSLPAASAAPSAAGSSHLGGSVPQPLPLGSHQSVLRIRKSVFLFVFKSLIFRARGRGERTAVQLLARSLRGIRPQRAPRTRPRPGRAAAARCRGGSPPG